MDRILKEHFDKFRDKDQLPHELCETNECSGMKLFGDKDLLNTWRNNFNGISWTDSKGNELRGAVDNILVKGNKLIVLDYKTRGYPLKEDTAEHYRQQQNIYNFLLRKNGYETEDYFFLLFYVPKEVTLTGEVLFDTTLVKMDVDITMAEKIWEEALKLLNSECPKEGCEWCQKI